MVAVVDISKQNLILLLLVDFLGTLLLVLDVVVDSIMEEHQK